MLPPNPALILKSLRRHRITMRRALIYTLVAAAYSTASPAAEQKTWSKIRYGGGTVSVKTSPYDWNTTLTVAANSDFIVIVIAPAKLFTPRQTVKIRFSEVISLSYGPGALRRVAGVPGAQLPPKAPTLFGLLEGGGFFGIIYHAGNGSRGALLLESYYSWSILGMLEALTGKPVDRSP